MEIMIIIVALIVGILPLKTKKGLKTRSISLMIAGVVILGAICLYANIGPVDSTDDDYDSTAKGFTIEKYKVVLDVSSSNVVNVTEYITTDFYAYNHHGIVKFVPQWLEYTDKTGTTISRKSKVSNLTSPDEYSIDTVKGKKRIKIGNAYTTIDKGLHEYQINYTYNMGTDPYKGFDEFIFHAFGDYWGTEIKNASLEIRMPSTTNISGKIHFFNDKYRKKDITNKVNYYVVGNTIYANVSPSYSLDKSLTVDIELPEGYFTAGNNSYGIISLTICLICITIAIISYILWKKHGKDFDKGVETVEFYPPDKLDAAEIGYLYKGDTGRKLSIALIIELASKGYIKIIESDDKRKQTIIKSIVIDLDEAIKREAKVIKLKEPRDKEKKAVIYNKLGKLFNGKQEIIIKSNFKAFYEEIDDLIKGKYVKIEYDTINNYTEEAITNIKKTLEERTSKTRPKLSSNEKKVYERLFKNGDETDLTQNLNFYKVFDEVSKNVEKKLESKVNDMSSYKIMLKCSLMFAVSCALWAIGYSVTKDMNPKFHIVYYIALASNFITMIFACLMGRKTTYGEQIKAKINGFRNYILVAEKDQIEALVEKDPKYFYNILPYAYVLDVSKKWIDKFENIPMPQNEMGNFDYTDIMMFDQMSNSIYTPSSSSSSSSYSGGCSSCGGGCSSCGGGCSSCGGGGSW